MYKAFTLMTLAAILAATSLLTGCGGGGGSSSGPAQDPQKTSVRAHLNDVYLWYDQVVDVPPSSYATAPAYFDALLVRSRDRFSFSMPQTAMVQMQEGVQTGFGVSWGWVAADRLFAFYVDPNSPAAASITRGAELTAINGQSVANLSASYLDYALFPEQAGSPVNFTLRSPGAGSTVTKSLASATFSTTTVSQPLIISLAGGGKAGYLLFNEHLGASEAGLKQAMTFFKEQGVGELVLDLRYNNGGYLAIAEEVASMIGGAPVQGKVFQKLLFNAKHPEKTQDPDRTFLFSALDRSDQPLPMLGLARVFVLTGSSTCSASESIINGLRPYLQVVLIGDVTCGKPYGFIPASYGDQAYFAIQYESVNANGSDSYYAGFAPNCRVHDDLNYPLGDVREARLKAALHYAGNGACPPASVATLPKAAPSDYIPPSGEVRMVGQKPGLMLVR